MSCQQVPRLTEDPYTFTEAAPATATLFNPQIHRLAPIIATNATTTNQKQTITQKSQTLSRVIHQPINQQSQIINARINGLSPIVNGVHKNVTTTSSSSKAQQQQLQYQSTKIAGNLTTKKFISPPVPSQNTITLHQAHPLYSIAKQQQQQQNSIISAAPSSTSVPLPPLFQKSTLSTPTTFLPQQSAAGLSPVEYHALQKNHSSTSKSIAVTIRTTQTPPPSVTTLTNYGPRLQQQQQQLPQPSLSLPNVVRKQQPPQQQFPAAKLPQTSTVDAKPSSDLAKRKSFETDQSVFVTPAKRDSRTVLPSGKKGIKIQSSPSVRTKRSYSQTSHHEALQRIPSSSSSSAISQADWHAPDSYIFDNNSSALLPTILEKTDDLELVPSVQNHWIQVSDIISCIPMSSQISREQRIELRKAQLRRQALQYISAQQFRTSVAARKRLSCVSKALRKTRERDEAPPPKKCCFPSCINDALALTAYCYLHITRNSDQYLFLPCTAKFSDNSQCRVPVFDISHELPLCREHAWKRDNYNRIVQEQKPKKPPRKRPKPSAMTRPVKRNKKKRKSSITTETVIAHNGGPVDEMNYIISRTPTAALITYNTQQLIHQDMLSICENSSAYESSEDTGVGGLSETELMVGTNEIAEEIPLGDTRLLEEHDLTNVLNQLPEDAFNELFTTVQQNGPLEPTQEEQEDLERALEAVNKQVKSLQQLTGGDSNFLGDFLDVVDDQMLDETDIAEVVLHSPNSSSIETIDTENIIISGGGRNSSTTADIRGLVQT